MNYLRGAVALSALLLVLSNEAYAFEKNAPDNALSNVELPAARTNLGLGSAATHALTDFLQPSNNLSDVSSAATARTSLGLGTGNTPAFTGLSLTGSGANGLLVTGSITGGYDADNYATGNAFSFLNEWTGGALTDGAGTGVFARLNYMPSAGDNGNHAGVYGDLWVNAPYTFTGLPAGVKGNSYLIAQITAAIATGGSDNAVGDTLTVTGGTCNTQLNTPPQFSVDAVSDPGGAVNAVTFLGSLGACTVYPGNPVTVTSSNGGATPPTLNLTVDATPDMTTGVIGLYGRVRNQSAGTVANAYSVYADGAYNSADGAITNAYSVYMVPPYTTTNPVGASYGLYAAGAFDGGTIAAADDVDISVVGSGAGSIKLVPGATGYTSIGIGGTERSGSNTTAGIYAYMESDADAYIDALATTTSASRLKLRAYNNTVYGGIQIEPDGGLLLGAVSFNALTQGELGFPKVTASGTAPGANGGKLEMVCGTNAGTLKLIAYGGTSTTPVTVLDNIGSGATGC